MVTHISNILSDVLPHLHAVITSSKTLWRWHYHNLSGEARAPCHL